MTNTNKKVSSIVAMYNQEKCALLDILRSIKSELGVVDQKSIKIISKELSIPESEIEGVLTFYSFLGSERSGKYTIRVCKTISCAMKNSDKILKSLITETKTKLNQTSNDKMFTLKECNCLGMCDQGPAILINNILISGVTADEIPELIKSCRNGKLNNRNSHRYISQIHSTSTMYEYLEDKKSNKEVYKTLSANKIIEIIKESGLRGRGGAGFPTGAKWEIVNKIESDQKYIICNADEGEPGTFKDRFLLDNYPDKVIEGLLVGAKAIGANKAIIYLRGEYSYLYEKLNKTILKYDFDISIQLGCGSYVCGEETSLIESLEGHRGEARNKPPYPVESGYNGKPTVVNNVETLIDVCLILDRGIAAFNKIGTDQSKGTKFFSISGDLDNPGIYEIPFGITIEQLLKNIGVKHIKSVQMGGASGTNIHKKDFEEIIAYEAIPTGGSIILFNKDRDMLEVARNFIDFFVDESCGQCVPCREGTQKILEGIDNIKSKQQPVEYFDELIHLGENIMSSSKCGLGQVCANAFISILKNHLDDIRSEINIHRDEIFSSNQNIHRDEIFSSNLNIHHDKIFGNRGVDYD